MYENKWDSSVEVCLRRFEEEIANFALKLHYRERRLGYYVDIADIEQIARIAVMRAHERCDPERLQTFDAFAGRWINRACKGWCRKQRREAARTRSEFDEFREPESLHSSDEQLLEGDEWDWIADQAELTPLEKRVIELRGGLYDPFGDGMSLLEAAKKLRSEGRPPFARRRAQSEIGLAYLLRKIELEARAKLDPFKEGAVRQ